MTASIQGSCMCAGVQFQAVGQLRDVVGCHCTECRKFSGHFTAATSVAPENLSFIVDHGLKWYRSSADAQRGFCQHCGCSLFWKPDSGDRISIFAGSLDGDYQLNLTSHIYMEQQGSYYEVQDQADKFATTGASLSVSNN